MKLEVGAYKIDTFGVDSRIIPLWYVKRLDNTKCLVFCLWISSRIKQIKILDKIKEILSDCTYIDRTSDSRLIVLNLDSFQKEIEEKAFDIDIFDLDFVKELEYEEVRETFGDIEKNKELWDLETYKEN